MKKQKLIYILLLASAGFYSSAYADNEDQGISFLPRAGIGFNDLKFKQQDGNEIRGRYSTLNVGITAQSRWVYASVDGELFGLDFIEKNNEITGVERQDYTVTIGVTPYKGLSIFGGYTAGELKDDFFGQFHDDRGYFGGLGYSFFIGQSSLGFSLAYADLDGEILEDEVGVVGKGDTQGYSYGLTWSGPFRDNMGYYLGLKVRKYVFDNELTNQEIDKDITSLSLGIIF